MDGINIMGGQIIGPTGFLSRSRRKRKCGLDNKELHLLIKCMKKKKIQAIKKDGFSIKSVVSGFHVSLSPLNLIFITMWIFMHTCGAVEGDNLTPSDWPSLNVTTTSDSLRISLSKTTFYSLAVVAGVLAVVWVLTIVAWLCCCKKKVKDSVGSAPADSEECSPLLHPVNVGQDQGRNPATYLGTVIQTLKEQKEELGEHRDQLIQQLKRTEADKAENKMKLKEVENTPGLLNKKEELLIIKWKLDDQQKEYEHFVLHVDGLVQKIDSLFEKVTE